MKQGSISLGVKCFFGMFGSSNTRREFEIVSIYSVRSPL